ncbi:MAG: phenylacetate--CoA ligase [Chloroflexota bacterium]
MIWNEAMETMPRAEIEALQSERLKTLASYVYERVPFYKNAFDAAGVSPDDVNGIEDLAKLPFTVKSDLRDNYPFDLFAVPMSEVIRTHASSGTTGKPTVVGYTREDIDTWSEVVARCFALSGAKPGEMFQNAYGYGLFTGGLGMHYGAELMGLTVIPVSGGNTARQVMLLQDFAPHVMACTPSYALTLADTLLAQGVDPADLNVHAFILGAEPWTEEMRQELEAKLKVNAVNIYGLSEIIGPGVSNECVEAKDGAHVFEDHFIVEALDPKTGTAVSDGEIGELVFTTLTKKAMPLIRYRTGDLATLTREKCICGRTHARMGRIVGRNDDMLIIRGVNVFPSQIEAALIGLENVSPHYRINVSRENRSDFAEVQVETTDSFHSATNNSGDAAGALQKQIHQALREALGLNIKITLLAPGEGPRSEGGKLKRVFDSR